MNFDSFEQAYLIGDAMAGEVVENDEVIMWRAEPPQETDDEIDLAAPDLEHMWENLAKNLKYTVSLETIERLKKMQKPLRVVAA